MNKLERIAETLDQAALKRRELVRFTASEEFSVEEGYEVQDLLLARQTGRGARIVGAKMGMTSKAKLQQMNLTAPIYGWLTSEMLAAGTVDTQKLIHPKIEPEIAFVTARELSGNLSREEALAACEGVAPALEIIDSRYKDFDFKLADVVADNCSSAAFAIGPLTKKPAFALDNLGMILSVNGQPAQFGSSAAILGDPVLSLIELVKLLTAKGKKLAAGSIVLAGGATAAVPFPAGSAVKLEVEKLGMMEIQAK